MIVIKFFPVFSRDAAGGEIAPDGLENGVCRASARRLRAADVEDGLEIRAWRPPCQVELMARLGMPPVQVAVLRPRLAEAYLPAQGVFPMVIDHRAGMERGSGRYISISANWIRHGRGPVAGEQ